MAGRAPSEPPAGAPESKTEKEAPRVSERKAPEEAKLERTALERR
jgi:hypothetical protein